VLVVTDKGLADAGHEQRAAEVLAAAGLHVAVFDEVHPNPTTLDVDHCVVAAKRNAIDFIVGLGGGSSMDCAKGLNFLLTNGGRMEDYKGIGKATKPMLPMIAVPTTAGTGSEAQSFALIANAKTHMKMACGDKKAACRVAILDPDLTASMPPAVAAATGIDAISHAVETSVTTARNPISQLFSSRAWKLLAAAFPKVVKSAQNETARGAMLLGAHLSGAAIENSMLGAAHALANPLSAHFGLTHGIAVGIMLPHVVRYNGEVAGDIYGRLAADAGLCAADASDAAHRLAVHLESLLAAAGLPTALKDCDVDSELFGQLADEAALQWTGNFNPRPASPRDFWELYQCAY
jgi:alcohol dehydrogenase